MEQAARIADGQHIPPKVPAFYSSTAVDDDADLNVSKSLLQFANLG